MKIFSTSQIKAWDQFTIEHEPVSSIDLMERAALGCTTWILENIKSEEFVIFCGTGNNGGDGLAIARQLHDTGKKMQVHILGDVDKATTEFKINFNKLKVIRDAEIHISNAKFELPKMEQNTVIIDCIFGIGINEPVTGWRSDVIESINRSGQMIIAIDLPSGLICDSSSVQNGTVIRASYTLTFQQPKVAFFFGENHKYVGRFIVIDIGLHQEFAAKHSSEYHYITKNTVKPILKARDVFTHKNQFGHLSVFAGSRDMMGAAVLTSRAGLRTGCGLVTAFVPASGREIFLAALSEAMCKLDEHTEHLYTSQIDNHKSAACVGPGIGTHTETEIFLERLLEAARIPLVLDADALNIIATRKLQHKIPQGSIITPHPGEFDRLFGEHADSFSRFKTLVKSARELKIIIILKGAFSSVAMHGGDVFFNSTGNSGMSTAGSGDVLTGIIGSLLAQGYSPTESSLLGVWMHGCSGDIAATEIGSRGLLASDITDRIPKAIDILLEP